MAGSPLKRQVLDALRTRAIEQLGENGDPLDLACDHIASGGSIAQLAREIGVAIGSSVSRPLLSGVLHNLAPDASERLDAARRQGAGALVEEAMQIADDAEPTTGAVQKARLQVGTRQWTAERWAPDMFGAKGTSVTLNIGHLMLDALRQPPPPRPFLATATVLLPETTDIEDVEDGGQ